MSAPIDTERARVEAAYARRSHGDRYAPHQPDQQAIARTRAHVWARWLRTRTRPVTTVVELGCGEGRVLQWLASRGEGTVVGVDLLLGRLARARRDEAVPDTLVAGDAREVPIRSGSVDVVVCSTLLSSVLDDVHRGAIAAEIDRLLAPDGLVLWFDVARNNPRNPDVRKVGRADLARVFPGYAINVERVVLAPPLARALRRWPSAARALTKVPPLRTHLAGALWRDQTRG